jgi:hypothetical protein
MNDQMGTPSTSRSELEDLWRERTQIALSRYQIAKDECRKAIAEQADAMSPDGSFAHRKALRAENAALAEYRRLLAIFNDLVTNGTMPPAE